MYDIIDNMSRRRYGDEDLSLYNEQFNKDKIIEEMNKLNIVVRRNKNQTNRVSWILVFRPL